MTRRTARSGPSSRSLARLTVGERAEKMKLLRTETPRNPHDARTPAPPSREGARNMAWRTDIGREKKQVLSIHTKRTPRKSLLIDSQHPVSTDSTYPRPCHFQHLGLFVPRPAIPGTADGLRRRYTQLCPAAVSLSHCPTVPTWVTTRFDMGASFLGLFSA